MAHEEIFEEKVTRWERQIQNVLIEMMREPNAKGLAINVDMTPLIKAFDDYMWSFRRGREKDKHILKFGEKVNDS